MSDKVKVTEADAHALPFPSDTFDAVLAESVLIFCEKNKVASEVYRVLKPGGVFGDNEATYVKHPLQRNCVLLHQNLLVQMSRYYKSMNGGLSMRERGLK